MEIVKNMSLKNISVSSFNSNIITNEMHKKILI